MYMTFTNPFYSQIHAGQTLVASNLYLFMSYVVPVEAGAPQNTEYEVDAKPSWVPASSVLSEDISDKFKEVSSGAAYWTTDHDDVCSACGAGGDLLECDHCAAVYHIKAKDCKPTGDTAKLTRKQKPTAAQLRNDADWACPLCKTENAANKDEALVNVYKFKSKGGYNKVKKAAAKLL